MDQVHELEAAILQRAQRLAEEYKRQAERGRDTILREIAEKLHLREQREVLMAKSKAERAFRRKVQANELRLHSEMDHQRWNLVERVRERMISHIEAYVADDAAYLQLFGQLLLQAAHRLECDTLVAEVNARDHKRLAPQWDSFVAQLGLTGQLVLHPEPIHTLGGVLVRSADNRVRLNNTFEGRLERLESRLHQVIIERLLPGDASISAG